MEYSGANTSSEDDGLLNCTDMSSATDEGSLIIICWERKKRIPEMKVCGGIRGCMDWDFSELFNSN